MENHEAGAQIIDRMMKALKIKRQLQLAALLGIDQSAISPYKKRPDVPEEWYRRLAQSHGLNPEYLRTGEGDPHRQETTTLPGQIPANIIQIPLVSSEFSKKGAFKPLPAGQNPIWLCRDRVREMGEFPEKLLMIQYTGKHMEPDVQRGDYVIFDQNRTYPEAFALCVVRIEDTMSVFRMMLGAGEVIFHSANGHTPPVHVPRERLGTVQAEILGLVVGVVRLGRKN